MKIRNIFDGVIFEVIVKERGDWKCLREEKAKVGTGMFFLCYGGQVFKV